MTDIPRAQAEGIVASLARMFGENDGLHDYDEDNIKDPYGEATVLAQALAGEEPSLIAVAVTAYEQGYRFVTTPDTDDTQEHDE